MTIVKFISDDFHRRATLSTYDLKSDLSVSKSLNIESSSFIDYNVTDITRTSSLGMIYVLDILYNYHTCSRGDKPLGHTPTRVIIGILYRIFLPQTPSNGIPAALRQTPSD
jgi:hypothetical protein